MIWRELIKFGVYNICNGRNGCLKLELIGTSQANMDLGIFQEKKLTNNVYTCGWDGFSVVTTDAPNPYYGRVAVFCRTSLHYAVENVQQFGTNVFGFSLEMW